LCLWLLGPGTQAEQPNLLKAEYSIREGWMLGARIELVIYEFYFDQDLYISSLLWCEPSVCEAPSEEDWSPCDYSLQGEDCGMQWRLVSNQTETGGKKHNNNQSSHETRQIEKRSCENREQFCLNEGHWMTLVPGVWTDPILSQPNEEPKNFRFLLSQPCTAFRITADTSTISNDISFFVSSDEPRPFTDTTQISFVDQVTVCPHFWNFKLGTWFVQLILNSPRQTKLRLEIFDVENKSTEIQNADVCPSFINYCPEFEKTYTVGLLPALTFATFELPISTCSNIFISLQPAHVPNRLS